MLSIIGLKIWLVFKALVLCQVLSLFYLQQMALIKVFILIIPHSITDYQLRVGQSLIQNFLLKFPVVSLHRVCKISSVGLSTPKH